MTKGVPGKVLLDFTLPVFLGNLFQEVYVIADTLIVGRHIGAKALAAVGATGMLHFFLFGFLWGITEGFAIPVAKRVGAGEQERVRQSAGCALVLTTGITLLMTALSLLFLNRVLRIMHTPEEIYDDACLYIRILCAGMIGQTIYNLGSGLIRALGNSRVPLLFLFLSSGLNIVLDVILVLYIPMGVMGAAFATVISEAVSALLCLIYIARKMPLLKVKRIHLRLRKDDAMEQLRVALPMASLYAATAIGGIALQSALNQTGTAAIAAYTAASKIDNTVQKWFGAEGVALVTFCAQNSGAKREDRIRDGIWAAGKQEAVYALFLGILLALFGEHVASFFLKDMTEEILSYMRIFLRVEGAFYLALAISNVCRSSLQGMGNTWMPMLAGFIELGIRCGASYVAGQKGSFLGVCLIGPFSCMGSAVFLGIVLMRRKRTITDGQKGCR